MAFYEYLSDKLLLFVAEIMDEELEENNFNLKRDSPLCRYLWGGGSDPADGDCRQYQLH